MTELVHPDRLKKLAELRAAGQDPFPARGVENLPIAEVLAGMGTSAVPGPRNGTEVQLAGRLAALRDFGKLMFWPLLDRSGRLQIGFQKDKLGAWWEQRKLLDAGDLVGVRGLLGFTQKGEPTLWASEVKLLAKALAPPPEKWHGLVDVEQRYRRRYVDLWASEGVKEVFILRSRMISLLRHFLEARGFLEVETPTLHPIAGGATARPFKTHHNALGVDLYLRIAPELYLKRLIVGGLERVFEVSRNFRNEGISTRHNPEFTMMELYQAQADFRHMMELTESLLEHLAVELRGTSKLEFRGVEYSLAKPFRRARYDELFQEKNGCSLHDEEAVARRARELQLKLPSGADHWKRVGDVFEATVEDALSGPVFVTHFPTPLCPLAKADPADPRFAERFELFLGGMELANAFSELNDPDEQHRRFAEQVASKDPEAPGEVDIDYVQALEYGMPPAGGLGIGLDRLAMVLTNQTSIRDVLLFPTLKPLARNSDATVAVADGAALVPKSEPQPKN
ncbi:MAG: lysine--tRNA ligase [Planctomycetota bacterium]